jgi:hypothetical protein
MTSFGYAFGVAGTYPVGGFITGPFESIFFDKRFQ